MAAQRSPAGESSSSTMRRPSPGISRPSRARLVNGSSAGPVRHSAIVLTSLCGERSVLGPEYASVV